MATENNIEIVLSLVNKIQGDLDKAKNQIQGFGKGVQTEFEKVGKSISQKFSDVFNKDITHTVRNSLLAISASIASVGFAAKMGIEVEDVTRAFDNLAQSAGTTGDRLRDSLSKGFGATVSQIDLMRSANSALLLGLPLTQDKFTLLAESANRLGDAVGLNATTAFDNLIRALASQSEKMLRTVGVTVNAEQAYRNFASSLGIAAEDLSDAQKQTAFMDATMQALQGRLNALGPDIKTAGQNLKEMAAGFVDLKNEVSLFVLEGLNKITQWMSGGDLAGLAQGIAQIRKELFGETTKDEQLSKNKEDLAEIQGMLKQGTKDAGGFWGEVKLTQNEINQLRVREYELQKLITAQQKSITEETKKSALALHESLTEKKNAETSSDEGAFSQINKQTKDFIESIQTQKTKSEAGSQFREIPGLTDFSNAHRGVSGLPIGADIALRDKFQGSATSVARQSLGQFGIGLDADKAKGGEPGKGGQQEEKSAKEKLKLLESIKKKMEQNDNKEKEAYKKIEQTVEKMTQNEDLMIEKMTDLFSIAGDHEGRISALEAKP